MAKSIKRAKPAAAAHPLTYRINTGETISEPFEASSLEAARAYVQERHPDYTDLKWLQVVQNGGWAWVL